MDQSSVSSLILDRFIFLLRKNRLAHAYLLAGPECVGKGALALSVAKLINCEQSKENKETFCNQCPSCLKINSGQHVDVHFLNSGSQEPIKIEYIRELLSQIALRPFMSEKKIFIIKNVENLTQEAANAFLKTLEEPTRNSLLLLTTAKPANVLDTIKSRCHVMYCYPVSRGMLAQQLEKKYALDPLKALSMANFSEGVGGRAKKLLENKFFDKRNEAVDQFIFSSDNEAFLRKIASDKQLVKEFLEIFLSWIRDAMLVKAGVHRDYLYHGDRFADLDRFQEKFTFGELDNLTAATIETSKLLADNLNVKIPLLLMRESLGSVKSSMKEIEKYV